MTNDFIAMSSLFARSTYALREYARSLGPVVSREAIASVAEMVDVWRSMEASRGERADQRSLETLDNLAKKLEEGLRSPDSFEMRFVIETSQVMDPPSAEAGSGPQPMISTSAALAEIAATQPNVARDYNNAMRKLATRAHHVHLLNQSALIAVLMYFEALVSNILVTFYHSKPQALSGESKILSFNELKSFQSMDEAIDYIVVERVDAQMRDSIDNWREFFERQLKVDFDGMGSWEQLVEVYQRRNLVVHNAGIVNRTYLRKVSPVIIGQLTPVPKMGEVLPVGKSYLESAIELVTNIGLGLVDQCWSRLVREDSDKRDDLFISVINDLLVEEAWGLLRKVCERFLARPTHDDSNRLLGKINYWLAMKRLGLWAEVRPEVEKFDRKACHPKYAMCVCSLLEDVDGFLRYLPGAVAGGVDRDALEHWPVLDEVRSDKRYAERVNALFTMPHHNHDNPNAQ